MISGVVRSVDGPVALARIAVEAAPGPVPDIAALTDEQGRFTIGTVGPGEYRLAVYADGFEPGRAEVRLSDAPVAVEFRLGEHA